MASQRDLEDAILAAVRRGDFETARARLSDLAMRRFPVYGDPDHPVFVDPKAVEAEIAQAMERLRRSDLAYKAPEQLPAFAGGQGREAASVESDAGGWLAQLAAVAMFAGILVMCWYLLS